MARNRFCGLFYPLCDAYTLQGLETQAPAPFSGVWICWWNRKKHSLSTLRCYSSGTAKGLLWWNRKIVGTSSIPLQLCHIYPLSVLARLATDCKSSHILSAERTKGRSAAPRNEKLALWKKTVKRRRLRKCFLYAKYENWHVRLSQPVLDRLGDGGGDFGILWGWINVKWHQMTGWTP